MRSVVARRATANILIACLEWDTSGAIHARITVARIQFCIEINKHE